MIICQNALPDILRAIDSMINCDAIYICDGGSTDGTVKWLLENKERYKLRVYKHKFESMRKQRNFLLSRIPKDSWVINLDQDEGLTLSARDDIKKYLDVVVIPHCYEQAKKSRLVVGAALKFYNLRNDFRHYTEPALFFMNKIFYNVEGIKFFNKYHCHVAYDKEKEGRYYAVHVPENFAIFHYAWFDKPRMESRKKRLLELPKKYGENEYNSFFGKKQIINKLPEGVV